MCGSKCCSASEAKRVRIINSRNEADLSNSSNDQFIKAPNFHGNYNRLKSISPTRNPKFQKFSIEAEITQEEEAVYNQRPFEIDPS